ncbi:Uncharacterised protein [Burkholderia cepacia]|nr:hypothetical protein DM41_6902 [Burkholderia cepacia ATCC 25416]SPU90554.1 Uncharacterised protein [Burkholderia cepacia]
MGSETVGRADASEGMGGFPEMPNGGENKPWRGDGRIALSSRLREKYE